MWINRALEMCKTVRDSDFIANDSSLFWKAMTLPHKVTNEDVQRQRWQHLTLSPLPGSDSLQSSLLLGDLEKLEGR